MMMPMTMIMATVLNLIANKIPCYRSAKGAQETVVGPVPEVISRRATRQCGSEPALAFWGIWIHGCVRICRIKGCVGIMRSIRLLLLLVLLLLLPV